jgi:hypothetical protein
VVFLLVLAVAVIGPFVGASWLSRHARREPATA